MICWSERPRMQQHKNQIVWYTPPTIFTPLWQGTGWVGWFTVQGQILILIYLKLVGKAAPREASLTHVRCRCMVDKSQGNSGTLRFQSSPKWFNLPTNNSFLLDFPFSDSITKISLICPSHLRCKWVRQRVCSNIGIWQEYPVPDMGFKWLLIWSLNDSLYIMIILFPV